MPHREEPEWVRGDQPPTSSPLVTPTLLGQVDPEIQLELSG
jgi:hypothetical protein